MKNKSIISFLFILIMLTSCTPRTITSAPTATMTAVPTATAAPTITPTPAPQSLADAPDLSTWIDDYVHAFGGKVTVNGVDMDAEQLTAAIHQNPEAFTEKKQINGTANSFFVVNEIPLAMRGTDENWRKVGYKDVSPSFLKIGTAVEVWARNDNNEDYFDDVPEYKQSVISLFNQITTGGALDSWKLQDKLDPDGTYTPEEVVANYDFSDFDKIVNFAKRNNLSLRVHPVCDGLTTEDAPNWLKSMSTSDLKQFLKLSTEAIVGRSKSPEEIVIVNEALWKYGFPPNNFFYSKLGVDYINIVADAAESTSPGSKLILSDNLTYETDSNHILNQENDALLQLVLQLRQAGTKINGVGIEEHLLARDFVEGLKPDQTSEIDARINQFEKDSLQLINMYMKNGIEFNFSELDVNIGGLPEGWSDQQAEQLKAKIYGAVFESALAGKIQSVTTWGFFNGASWMFTGGYSYGEPKSPLPIDKQFRPTASFYQILQVLYSYSG